LNSLDKAFEHLLSTEEFRDEMTHFARLASRGESGKQADILFPDIGINEIDSTGYVVSTLEAAIWCLLNTGSFRGAVLKAVNLGGDTDTVGSVCGGLAGLYYRQKCFIGIPPEWEKAIQNKELLEHICTELSYELGFNHEYIVEKVVTDKDSWKHTPIRKPKKIAFGLGYSEDHFALIKEGLYPYEMEDKWFVYFEEGNMESDYYESDMNPEMIIGHLHFCRSWSGHEIYDAPIYDLTDTYKDLDLMGPFTILYFYAEWGIEVRPHDDDNRDQQTLAFLIHQGLLGEDVKDIYLQNEKEEFDAWPIKLWHRFGRMVFD
jgi:hypothetical protein